MQKKPAPIPLGYLNFIVPEVNELCICERSFPVEILYHQHTENSVLKWEREEGDKRILFSQKITLKIDKDRKKKCINYPDNGGRCLL